jgi:hypothetical protein
MGYEMAVLCLWCFLVLHGMPCRRSTAVLANVFSTALLMKADMDGVIKGRTHISRVSGDIRTADVVVLIVPSTSKSQT